MLLILLAVLFVIMLVCSAPISFVMGGSATFAMLVEGKAPLIAAIQRLFAGMDSLTLLAIPFFMLAGTLMERGGISKSLIAFANSLVAHFKGGLAMVAVLASMIFAAITGSSTAATSAIGSIMIPEMEKKQYPKGFTATLLASSGMLGPIIPPSNIMVIYCSITGISVGALFMAGFAPGIALGVGMMVISRYYAAKAGVPLERRASFKQVVKSFLSAFWALLMPIIIIGGILSGKFTATEAGVVACVYGLVIGIFVYKGIKIKDLPDIFLSAAKSSSSILLITGMAYITGWMLARLQFPRITMNFLMSLTDNPHIFMLLCMVFFLILGMFMETVAAIVIFVPVLYPIAAVYGIHPIHFALILLVTLMIGQITPPVGILLFLTSALSKITIKDTFKYLPPFLIMMVIVTVLFLFFPDITLWLPRLIYGTV